MLVKNSQASSAAADIKAGHTGGLEDWTAHSLSQLSRHVVGHWHYQRPMGGQRVSYMTAALHSCLTRGELVRISAEKPMHGGGQLTALTNWTRIDVTFGPSAAQISVNGGALGALGLASGRLSDANGAELGAYQRGHDSGRLFLRGRDVAVIRPAPEPASQLPHVPEPFCSWVMPAPDEEATLWVIALTAIEAGNFAMPVGGMVV